MFGVLCRAGKTGLKQERRALRIKVGAIGFELVDEHTLQLAFELPPGAYATVLLEQLGEFGKAAGA